MNTGRRLFKACLAALVVIGIPAATAAEPAVVAQDLVNVRASGKIAAALWTRRPDSYTLQLVLGTSGSRVLPLVDGRRMVTPSTTLVLEVPEIRVWLLRADGRQILPTWYTPGATSKPEPCFRTCEKLYRFPLADSAEAVAMAIRIDDEYYIEKLESLVPRPAVQ